MQPIIKSERKHTKVLLGSVGEKVTRENLLRNNHCPLFGQWHFIHTLEDNEKKQTLTHTQCHLYLSFYVLVIRGF